MARQLQLRAVPGHPSTHPSRDPVLVAGVCLSGPFPQVRTPLTRPHRRTDGMTTHCRSGLVSASTIDAVLVKLCSEFHDLDITFSVVRNYSTGTRWLPAMMSMQQKKMLRVMNWVHVAAVPRGEPQAVQGPGVAAHHHVNDSLLYCTSQCPARLRTRPAYQGHPRYTSAKHRIVSTALTEGGLPTPQC